ncbi:MAG: TIGR03905 family TSCPD domain-containing protein [Clostridia bacterium]|nr:TIGR03905 family TSCPD domain-containing protein [Clostridia bacterium]
MNTYRTRGTCSRSITFEVTDEGTLHNVQFEGGCNGNLQGIAALVEGMDVQDAIDRLAGIQCGYKATSCPDQLAQALIEYQEEN